MPNPDPLRAKIEALRGRSSASVQGGVKTEIPVHSAPISSPTPQKTSSQGGLDKSRLDALRGRANLAQAQTVSKNKAQEGFATQRELEEGMPTPLLDTFLEEIILKIQNGN